MSCGGITSSNPLTQLRYALLFNVHILETNCYPKLLQETTEIDLVTHLHMVELVWLVKMRVYSKLVSTIK